MAELVDAAERAAALVRRELTPAAIARWEQDGAYPRPVAASSGLTGLFVGPEDRGLGLGYPAAMEVFEELGRGDAAFAFSLSMHNAVAAAVAGFAEGELRRRWLAPLVRGEALGGFSLTEPHAGSDATAITTRARRDGAAWRVSGRKAWVSLAGEADLFLVVCRTGEGGAGRDAAMVAVARDAQGVSFPRFYRTACAGYLRIGDMELDGAAGALLFPPGQGMRAALSAIDVARCDIAAIACGLHAAALEAALRHTHARTAFGRRLLDFQGLQWTLADALTELEASRLLVRHAAEALGTPAGPVAVAHAKRFAPDAALRAAVTASEALGAYGWLDDRGLVRAIALAKMLQVVDGTAEIQRVVIGRELARRVTTESDGGAALLV